MVRQIRSGTDALIKALTAAGVQVTLGAIQESTGIFVLKTFPEVNDALSGLPTPWPSALVSGTSFPAVTFVGSQGVVLQQRAATREALVQERVGGVDIDPRDVLDRSAREVGRVRDWGNAWTQVAGLSFAPVANTIMADTGALAAGDYDMRYAMSIADTLAAGKCMRFEHRDAANAVTLSHLGGCPAGGAQNDTFLRYPLAINERVRIVVGSIAGAASSEYLATIRYRTAG